MGFSLKKSLGSLGGMVGASAGFMLGGPAGAAIGYGLGSSAGGMFQQDMAEDYTKQAWERNLTMWNMNNAYNDPSAQMQRLKAAGLNPNLVYGSGNVVGNTSNGGYGNFETDVVGQKGESPVLAYQRLMSNDATIRNTEAEIASKIATIENNEALTEARVNLMNSQARNADINSSILDYDLNFYNSLDKLLGDNDILGKAGLSNLGKLGEFITRQGIPAFFRGLRFR